MHPIYVVFTLLALTTAARAEDPSPEAKALAYLSKEVPSWSKANRCFSCHNNGDAARALMAAPKDLAIEPKSLADTLRFLSKPESWNEHEADSPNKDARLARIQFASAMVLAFETKRLTDLPSFVQAAEKLAADQAEDGSWPIESDENVGSPATYGRTLATSRARRTLFDVDAKRFERAISKADRWLREHPIRNVPEAAAILLGLPSADAANEKSRKAALDFLIQAQSKEGGWGPFSRSAFEPFDTALALLALAQWSHRDEVREPIGRGRQALVASQLADGSWPETTRPAGAESYAQRLSTAGWATLALLATR